MVGVVEELLRHAYTGKIFRFSDAVKNESDFFEPFLLYAILFSFFTESPENTSR